MSWQGQQTLFTMVFTPQAFHSTSDCALPVIMASLTKLPGIIRPWRMGTNSIRRDFMLAKCQVLPAIAHTIGLNRKMEVLNVGNLARFCSACI